MSSTHEVQMTVTLVMGDISGWGPRLVYRSVQPALMELSVDGRFAALPLQGHRTVCSVVTPEGQLEPVLYAGPCLPAQPPTLADGWAQADMPAGVISQATFTDVLMLAWDGESVSGYCSSLWLDRPYRPMERFDLPVGNPLEATTNVPCRVLEAGAGGIDGGVAVPYLVVTADTEESELFAHWESQEWIQIRQHAWMELRDLSGCVEAVSHPLRGTALLAEVRVHDLLSLNAESLTLLPMDVRDGLERTLLASE